MPGAPSSVLAPSDALGLAPHGNPYFEVEATVLGRGATGFMSNRGRQNVASFLALDMKLEP